MGSGLQKAVATVFPDSADFICHFHFLRDLGKDLFEREYTRILNRLRSHGITTKLHNYAKELLRTIDNDSCLVDSFTRAFHQGDKPVESDQSFRAIAIYTLIQWLLDAKRQANGYGFPFDRTHLVFSKRLLQAFEQLPAAFAHSSQSNPGVDRIARRLARDLKNIHADEALGDIFEEIEWKIELFDELRDAMRIAPKSGSDGLNCAGQDVDIHAIECAVNDFCRRLRTTDKFTKNKECIKALKQLDKGVCRSTLCFCIFGLKIRGGWRFSAPECKNAGRPSITPTGTNTKTNSFAIRLS